MPDGQRKKRGQKKTISRQLYMYIIYIHIYIYIYITLKNSPFGFSFRHVKVFNEEENNNFRIKNTVHTKR